ncbi:MAG: hypothetical protein ACFCU4_05780 [Puniceicoccaceae bacterium]
MKKTEAAGFFLVFLSVLAGILLGLFPREVIGDSLHNALVFICYAIGFPTLVSIIVHFLEKVPSIRDANIKGRRKINGR